VVRAEVREEIAMLATATLPAGAVRAEAQRRQPHELQAEWEDIVWAYLRSNPRHAAPLAQRIGNDTPLPVSARKHTREQAADDSSYESC